MRGGRVLLQVFQQAVLRLGRKAVRVVQQHGAAIAFQRVGLKGTQDAADLVHADAFLFRLRGRQQVGMSGRHHAAAAPALPAGTVRGRRILAQQRGRQQARQGGLAHARTAADQHAAGKNIPAQLADQRRYAAAPGFKIFQTQLRT